jgi:O-antigen/teichoic acid export membrane protein
MSSTTTSLGNQVLSGLIWSAVRNWGGRLATIAVFFLLARILSPDEFGVFAAAIAVLAFIEIIAEQGLADAVVQRPAIGPRELNTVFVANFLVAALLVTATWLGAPLIASVMGIERLTEILRVSCLGILISSLGFCQQALFRRNFQYRWLAVRTLASTVLSGAVGVGLALAGFGVWSLVGQFLTSTSVNLILLWLKPVWKPGLKFSFVGFGQLLRYGSNVLGMRLLDFANTRAIELAIGAWLGTATLGFYAVGSRIYTIMMQLLSSVVMDVAHSGFSRIAGERERLAQAYYRAMTATAALAMPCFVLVSAVASELCVTAFGAKWANSADILAPLALLGAVQTLQYYNASGLNAIGRSATALAIAIVKAAGTGAALVATKGQALDITVKAYVLAQLVATPVSFYLGKRYLGVSIRRILRCVIPFALSAAMMFFAVGAIGPALSDFGLNRLSDLVVKLAAGITVYAMGIALLGRRHLIESVQTIKSMRRG